MQRAVLIIAMLVLTGSAARSSVDVYPPLNRETLVGAWEALFGIETIPVVFHIVIAPSDSDSYLSEIYPESMKGRLFRMDSCTITEAKVKLHFRSIEPNDSSAYWIEGEAYGDEKHAWIRGTFGTQSNAPGSGPAFYAERRTWVRDLGEASVRAAEKIKKIRDAKK